jgi:hypothetical protein
MSDELNDRIYQLEHELGEQRSLYEKLGSMLEKSNNQAHTFYNISSR